MCGTKAGRIIGGGRTAGTAKKNKIDTSVTSVLMLKQQLQAIWLLKHALPGPTNVGGGPTNVAALASKLCCTCTRE